MCTESIANSLTCPGNIVIFMQEWVIIKCTGNTAIFFVFYENNKVQCFIKLSATHKMDAWKYEINFLYLSIPTINIFWPAHHMK
jgi:mRNA-degrading endonuclease HigB of HigAB toxin-antitoxin module